MEKQDLEASFLELFLDSLIFLFVIFSIVLRFFISGLRANLAGPMGSSFLNITYGQERSIHFFVIALLLFSTVAMVLKNILKEHMKCIRTGVDWPLIGIVILGWLSVTWSSHLYSSLLSAFNWLSLLLFFYVISNLSFEGWGKRILNILLCTGIIISALAMFEYFDVYPQVQKEFGSTQSSFQKASNLQKAVISRVQAREVSGPFLTSNILGGFLAILIPVFMGLLCEFLDRKKHPFLKIFTILIGLIFLGIALVLTGSKGAWLALGVGITLFCFLIFRKLLFQNRKKTILTISFITACLLVSFGIVFSGSNNSFRRSLDVRLDYYHSTWQMIQDHMVIGCGLNNFHSYYAAYKLPEAGEMIYNTHNDYLEIWAELGIFGFLLYLWIWIAFFRKIHKTLDVNSADSVTSKKKKKKKKKKSSSSPEKTKLPSLKEEWLYSISLVLGGGIALILLKFIGASLISDPKIFGWLLFAWILVSIFLSYPIQDEIKGKVQYKNSPHENYYTQIGILSGIGVFLFHGLGSFVLYSPSVFLLILVLMGILCGQYYHLIKEKPKQHYLIDRPMGMAVQLVIFALFFGLIFVALFGLQTTIKADQMIQKGDKFYNSANQLKSSLEKLRFLEKAQLEYIRAYKTFPLDEKVAGAIGRISEKIHAFKGKQEDLDMAKKYYEIAKYLAPRNHGLDYHLYSFYKKYPWMDSNGQKRQSHLESATKIFPSKPQYRYTLGKFYVEQLRSKNNSEMAQKALVELKAAKYYNQRAHKNYKISAQKIERALKKLVDLNLKKKR